MAKKVKNLSLEDTLRALLELQKINTKLDELRKLQGELPLEVEALESDINKLDDKMASLEEEKSSLTTDENTFRNQIKDAEGLIERYTRQKDEVKNNREFEALTKEIELQHLEIQLANKRIREVSTKITYKEETLQASVEKKEQKEADLQLKREELQKITEKTEKDEKRFLNKDKKARNKVDDNLLRNFDRVRGAYKNGLAVATIDRNSCGGCFNEVPPQLQIDIKGLKKISTCEHCGRVLIDEHSLNAVQDE